jgi:hypothetical protein
MPPRRSTPKVLHRASELRKEATPAESKLWSYLRLMREDGVRFRRQHAIGPFIADFVPHERKSSSSWMATNISSNTTMIRSEQITWKRKATQWTASACQRFTA